MLAALLLSACFPRLDPEDAARPDDSGGTPLVESRCGDGEDDDGDGEVDCDDADCADATGCGSCWDEEIGDDLGASVASGTASGNDGSGSCGGGSTPDTFVYWTAPATDYYMFDTVGSDADTVLWLAADECEGDELGCNDDTFGTDSQVLVQLTRGDTVVIGVEASGSWVLNAWQGECPDYTIGSTLGVEGSTASMTNDYTASCQDAGNAIALRWIAPSSGTWTFSTDGSDFDTVLALFDGSCEGTELACNDDSGSTAGPSSASVTLTAGDVVSIVLGGYEGETGSYSLTIE